MTYVLVPRIIYLTASVYSVLLFASFTAYLTSLITSNHAEIPLRYSTELLTKFGQASSSGTRSWSDVVASDYRVMTFKSSFYETILKTSPAGSHLQELYLRKMEGREGAWITGGADGVVDELRKVVADPVY